MMSGCAMLESLILEYFGSLEYLDLSKSLRLKRLDIDFTPWVREPVQIVAPHIYSLRLYMFVLYDLENMNMLSSL